MNSSIPDSPLWPGGQRYGAFYTEGEMPSQIRIGMMM